MTNEDTLVRRIREALFHRDMPHERRRDACLSVHALLSGRTGVVRIFIPDRSIKTLLDPPWDAVRQCLYTSSRLLREQTDAHLTDLGLMRQRRPDALAFASCQTAQEMCEDCLRRGWGDGLIHYEMARLTPFSPEDIADRLWPKESWRQMKPAHLSPILRPVLQRRQEKDALRAQHRETCDFSEHLAQSASEFDRVYRQKLESAWQERWGSPARYGGGSKEARLLAALGTDAAERSD